MREQNPANRFVLGAVGGLGKLIMYDSMEGVQKWDNIAGWGTLSIRKVNGAAYNGNFGIQLYTNRTLANGVVFGYRGRKLPGIRHGVVRVETRIRSEGANLALVPPIRVCAGLALKLEWWDGEYRRVIGIAFQRYDQTVLLFQESFTDYPIGSYAVESTGLIWHRFWMEYDIDKDVYVTAGINEKVFDVSSQTAGKVASTDSVCSNVLVGLATWEIGRHFANVDDVAVYYI